MSDEPQQHDCNREHCSILLNRHPTLCPFLGPCDELVPFPTGVRHREVWPEIPHPCLMVKMRDRRHITMAPEKPRSVRTVSSCIQVLTSTLAAGSLCSGRYEC
jgi:hypothetical protein